MSENKKRGDGHEVHDGVDRMATWALVLLYGNGTMGQ